MSDDGLIPNGLGPFHLLAAQRTAVRVDADNATLTFRVVGGDGTVAVNVPMLPRIALELANQIVTRVITREGLRGFQTTLGEDDLLALDAWIAQQPEPRPSRPEAVRVALREWLAMQGVLGRSAGQEEERTNVR